MISLRYNKNEAQSEFKRILESSKNPRAILVTSGRELANLLKDHFRKKDRSSANKLSERRTHFWLAVSRTVQNPVVHGESSVSVTVNHPAIAQKVFGGKITAKRAGALTIPVEEKAYGRTASTFEHETGLKLFLIRTGKGSFQNAVLAVRNAGGGIQVEYILTKSVTQAPDPTALPSESEMEKAITERAQKVLDSQTGGKAI